MWRYNVADEIMVQIYEKNESFDDYFNNLDKTTYSIPVSMRVINSQTDALHVFKNFVKLAKINPRVSLFAGIFYSNPPNVLPCACLLFYSGYLCGG